MGDSLDIEEINRTRAALGMALLPNSNGASNLEFKSSGGADAPADEDLGSTLESREAQGFDNYKKMQDEAVEKKKREARREALKRERDIALRSAKLEGKGLGDMDGDEMDTRAWLLAQNKRQKKIAKERAKILEKELEERENQAQYTEKDLAGLKVGHELGDFDEGEQIVTLKDTAVDAEDEDDELENADLRAKERLTERIESKKRKPVYDPHAVDESGEHSLLAQYDDEAEVKKQKQKRFTLDGQGRTVEETRTGGQSERSGPQGMKFSLDFMQEDKPVSDYVDISEVKIRKPKKKKDKSKRNKTEDDMFATDDMIVPRADAMDIDHAQSTGPADAFSSKRRLEETSFVDDDDLQSNLAAQRRAALKKRKMNRPEDIARQLREEGSATPGPMNSVENDEEGGLIIDETSEFVANLQKPEAPVKQLTSFVKSTTTDHEAAYDPASPEPDPEGDVDMDKVYGDEDGAELEARLKRTGSAPTPEARTVTGLEDEQTLEQGVGAALRMLTGRGILKTADTGDLNAIHRERQRFLHEKQQRETNAGNKARLQREKDRASGKFERMSAKEREQYAQWENKQRDQQDSRQQAEVFNRDYKPSVNLKYIDDHGRSMDQREAFKHLSHQFHGKGSGKQKTEKRLKKIEDEKKRDAISTLDASQSTGMNSAMGATARKNRQAGVRLQ